MKTARSSRQFGITMVEQLVTVAVAATALGVAAPDFDRLVQRHRIEGVASTMETDLQHARSLAVARNETVRFELDVDESAACYVVHNGPRGACRCETAEVTVCEPGVALLRSVHFTAADHIALRGTASSVAFDPALGTATPTTSIDISNAKGDTVRLVVNIMGRVRGCAPATPVPGLVRC